jgi:hypothetical protein
VSVSGVTHANLKVLAKNRGTTVRGLVTAMVNEAYERYAQLQLLCPLCEAPKHEGVCRMTFDVRGE